MSTKENDILTEALHEFCEERGLAPVDIMNDERGAYYKEQAERDIQYAVMQHKMLKGIFDHSFFRNAKI